MPVTEKRLDQSDYRVEHSCGAVVFTRQRGEILYVIAQMRNGRHGFPKGHREPGETEQQTALREIFEEVGLRPRLLEGFREEQTYLIPELEHTAKTVTLFLAEYENQTISIQEEELLGAQLLPYEKALEILEYEDSREILRIANDFLNKREHHLD